ncbi:MAG: MATE family efflux transporter [Lachnospiraceae bacterium]|nr:MATE family efflux transporter [Lachnospiraceae bacterium]
MSDFDTQYKRMTETPVQKLVIQLGIPTIISMLITNIYNMADTWFVSSIGTSASGAVGVVFGLMAILQAFGFMLGHGGGSIISRLLGGNKKERATIYASTSFFLSLLIGGLIGILGIIFLSPLMRLLGSTETILPYARDYGFYILLAAPFMTASCVLNNILRYEGLAFYAMIGLTAGGILNMAGDPIFMFVLGFGTAGAGMSTAFSQIISFFLLLYPFLSGRTQSKLSLRKASHSIPMISNILTIGSPSLIRQGLSSISTMLLNNQAAIYGDAAVAAMSITNRVTFFIFAVGLGIGQGFQPVSAFNYGAKKYDRVKEAYSFTVVAGLLLLGAFSAIVFFNAEEIICFFRNDPEVIEIGGVALRWQCVACLFQPLSVCTNMLFQSIGKAGRAAFLSALRSGLYFVPLILILPRFLGLLGVEISQTIADIGTALTSIPFALAFFRDLKEKET